MDAVSTGHGAVRAPVAGWVLLGVTMVAGLITGRAQVEARNAYAYAVVDVLTGVAICGAGVAVWRRRPDNACWWLLGLSGLTWFVGSAVRINLEGAQITAFVGQRWYFGFLLAALLAYPTGRIVGTARPILALTLLALTVHTLSRLLLYVPTDVANTGTSNWLTPVSDPAAWLTIEDAFAYVQTGLVLATTALMAARWWHGGRPERQMRTPPLLAGAALTVAVGVENLAGWNAPFAALEVPSYLVRYVLLVVTAWSIAYGLRQLRLTRIDVVEVVADLGDVPVDTLRAGLARALDDPSLRVARWSEQSGGYVDGDVTIDPINVRPGRAVSLVSGAGGPVAAVEHNAVLLEDPGLVDLVTGAVRATAYTEQLRAELQDQLAAVEESRARLVAAADDERRRVERDLHDGAQQRLVSVALNLRLAQQSPDVEPAAAEAFGRAADELAIAIDELRSLARGLHPAIVSEAGLAAALESLADRSPVPVTVDVRLTLEPADGAAVSVYFAVAEVLTNVAKHSGATHVWVCGREIGGQLVLTARDDGRGGAVVGVNGGLRGVSDRLDTVGGQLIVRDLAESSDRGAHGTEIEVSVPCGS